jgi:hypothetical protein
MMRWAVHMACMGEGRYVYRVSIGRPKGRQKLMGQTGFGWLMIGFGGRHLFDKLSDYQPFKYPAPQSECVSKYIKCYI